VLAPEAITDLASFVARANYRVGLREFLFLGEVLGSRREHAHQIILQQARRHLALRLLGVGYDLRRPVQEFFGAVDSAHRFVGCGSDGMFE
jgi:hypothetical protein